MKLAAYLAHALREAVESGNWRRWGKVDFWPLTFLDKKGKRLQGILRVETTVHSIIEHPKQDAPAEEPPKSLDELP
jgi:hypothetical protein